ncbi:hypothetical protein N665_0171s0009 [Sinapis alba]|nr:hypothetical protein N665_0171s0009 [Sinapis alba]
MSLALEHVEEITQQLHAAIYQFGWLCGLVTDKPQTTRHRILGICSTPHYQMILYDTPGVIEKKMHRFYFYFFLVFPRIVLDCVYVLVRRIIPVSAKYGHGVEDVKEWILSKLPFAHLIIPSEHPERFFVAEIVREKIFMKFLMHVSASTWQVNVLSYKTRPAAKDFIQVVVDKNSQKIILIGKELKALKTLATAARLDIEDFLHKKMRVQENWRQDEGLLKYYGYGGQIRVM